MTDQTKIPSQYICPISLDIMSDPVILANGQTYDRKSIQDWFRKGHATDPLTNVKLASKQLITNYALKNAINLYLKTTRNSTPTSTSSTFPSATSASCSSSSCSSSSCFSPKMLVLSQKSYKTLSISLSKEPNPSSIVFAHLDIQCTCVFDWQMYLQGYSQSICSLTIDQIQDVVFFGEEIRKFQGLEQLTLRCRNPLTNHACLLHLQTILNKLPRLNFIVIVTNKPASQNTDPKYQSIYGSWTTNLKADKKILNEEWFF